ncbi:MAG: hypothetical protein FWF43_01405 [Propionibacteriaceae bacterium]|nr:hypothetical protein [Propionibacteriaceae bacterium]
MTLNRIDVSADQSANITSFLPHDLTYIEDLDETDEMNTTCDPALQTARTVSQLMGIYHFAQPVSATAETDSFVTYITKYVGTSDWDWDTPLVDSGSVSDTAWMDRVSVQPPPQTRYQSHDKVRDRWLPEVIGTNGFTGVIGHELDCLACEASSYRVHLLGGHWLPEVTRYRISDLDHGVAGILGQPIDGVAIQGKSYRIHTLGGSWLPWINQYDLSDWTMGVAGIPGQAIDAIQIQ